jgi:hypothetical protein
MRTTHKRPTQLDLQGTLAQTVSLQEQLARSMERLCVQQAEGALLRGQLELAQAERNVAMAERDVVVDQLHEARMAQLAAVSDRLKADKQLREAKSQILVLQSMADGLIEVLRQRTQEAPPVDQAWLVKELTRLLTVCHPDKWQNSPVAEALTKEVLAVRQRLQGTTAGRKGARR